MSVLVMWQIPPDALRWMTSMRVATTDPPDHWVTHLLSVHGVICVSTGQISQDALL
jgi:hypothetical protein